MGIFWGVGRAVKAAYICAAIRNEKGENVFRELLGISNHQLQRFRYNTYRLALKRLLDPEYDLLVRKEFIVLGRNPSNRNLPILLE